MTLDFYDMISWKKTQTFKCQSKNKCERCPDTTQNESLLVFLYRDAVFYAAGQEEEVLKLQSFILLQDVVLDLLQLSPELVNQLLGFPLREVVLCVFAQRYLGKRQQKAAEDRGTNVDDVM